MSLCQKKENALEDVTLVAGTQQNLSNLYYLDIYGSYTYGGGITYYYLMSVVPKGSVFTKQLTNYYLGRGALHQK